MDIEIKKIIDLYKIDQEILEINENKGALPSIIKEQEKQVEDLEANLMTLFSALNLEMACS